MAPPKTRPADHDAPPHLDWVIAGLRTLADSGIDAIKVEPLAKTLGVSKGPFYWRFTDRADLLAHMLDYWKREFTMRLIEHSAPLETPRARLEELLVEALAFQFDGLDVARVEAALRAWAAQDATVGETVRAVDAQRVQYLTAELQAMGAAPALAGRLARGIYLGLLGLFTARRYTPGMADDEAYKTMVMMALDAAEGRTRP